MAPSYTLQKITDKSKTFHLQTFLPFTDFKKSQCAFHLVPGSFYYSHMKAGHEVLAL